MTSERNWTKAAHYAAVDALFAAVAHAQSHRDTSFVVRAISVVPRDLQWRYAQWIRGFSPIVLRAKGGEISGRLIRREDEGYREFDFANAAATLTQCGLAALPAGERPALSAASNELQKLKSIMSTQPLGQMDHTVIKERALKALEHASRHHEISLMQALIRDLPAGYWEKGFANWLRRFSPIRLNRETGRLYQIKFGTPEYISYDLEGAQQHDILSKSRTWDIRRVIADASDINWQEELSHSDHMELLQGFQELVTAMMGAGAAKTASIRAILYQFGLEWRRRLDASDYFIWPSTSGAFGVNRLNEIEAPQVGMFSALGYRVGKVRGQSQQFRTLLLDHIFLLDLPPINGPEYMRSWGKPGTPARLKKMAQFIAQEIKNANRKVGVDMSVAVADWSQDHEYIYREYYVGRFKFAFPTV